MDRDNLIRQALTLGEAHDRLEEQVIDLWGFSLRGRPPAPATWEALLIEHDRVEYTLLAVYARLKLLDPAALEAIRNGEDPLVHYNRTTYGPMP